MKSSPRNNYNYKFQKFLISIITLIIVLCNLNFISMKHIINSNSKGNKLDINDSAGNDTNTFELVTGK